MLDHLAFQSPLRLRTVHRPAGVGLGRLAIGHGRTNIYWAEAGDPYQDGAIMTVPKTGVLASKQLSAHALTVDDSGVYWLTGGLQDGDASVMSVCLGESKRVIPLREPLPFHAATAASSLGRLDRTPLTA